MPSNTERKQYVYYGGNLVEYLGQAEIFGKVYYDIRIGGVKKTVRASMCSAEPKQETKSKGNNKTCQA